MKLSYFSVIDKYKKLSENIEKYLIFDFTGLTDVWALMFNWPYRGVYHARLVKCVPISGLVQYGDFSTMQMSIEPV